MNSYNFDNIDFDIDFGTVDKAKHEQMLKQAENQ